MKLEEMLLQAIEEAKQAAREIYYARKHIREGGNRDWILGNLDAALFNLGVRKPEDVDLSSSALGEKKQW
jgi:hypothetical protein